MGGVGRFTRVGAPQGNFHVTGVAFERLSKTAQASHGHPGGMLKPPIGAEQWEPVLKKTGKVSKIDQSALFRNEILG